MKRATKRWIVLILVILLLLTACQPTPEKEPIVNKGDAKFEIKLQTTPKILEQPAQLKLPETWSETISIGDSNVMFDASVECPVDYFPVYEAEKDAFTPEQMNGLLAVLAPDAEKMRPTGISAEEIHENLEAAIRGWWYEDGTGEGYYGPYEGQEEDIAHWQAMLAKASEGTTPFAPFEKMPIRQTILCASGKRLCVYAYENSWSINIDLGHSAVLQWERLVASGGAIGNEPIGTKIGEVHITPEQAKAQATKMLQTMGLTDAKIAAVEKARMVNALTEEVVARGYQVMISRGDGGYAPFDTLTLSYSIAQYHDAYAYQEPWFPERIQMFVDEQGVRNIARMWPLRIVRTVNENVELLPFDEVQELFRKRFRQEFRWSEMPGTIRVDRVALVGAMVRVKNDPDRVWIVPAWLCEFTTQVGGMPEDTDRYAIAINAIDGTNVDVLMA